MFRTPPRGSQLGLLAINVVGWLLFFFFYARIDAKEPESQVPAVEARLTLVEMAIEKLAAQFETSTQKLGAQLDVLEKQAETQLAEAAKKQKATQPDQVSRLLSEAQLRKLENATARLEDELGTARARTHVTVDLNSLVQGLRPNVSFGVLRTDIKKPGVVDLTFQVRNSGTHAAIVEVPELVLATKPVPASGPVDGRLVAAQDYSVQGRTGTFLPNEPSNHAYTVTLTDPKRLEQPLYYRMTFRTSTDPTVVAASSRLLQGKVAAKDIQELSVSHYTHLGELSVAR
jgi:hypothetical protein